MEAVIQYPGFADKSLDIIGEARGSTDHAEGRFLYDVGTAKPTVDGVIIVRHSISANGLPHLVERIAAMGLGTTLYVHLVGRSTDLGRIR